MKKKWEESEYKSVIRLKPEKQEWIRENKGKSSMAGFLNKIINYYIKNK